MDLEKQMDDVVKTILVFISLVVHFVIICHVMIWFINALIQDIENMVVEDDDEDALDGPQHNRNLESSGAVIGEGEIDGWEADLDDLDFLDTENISGEDVGGIYLEDEVTAVELEENVEKEEKKITNENKKNDISDEKETKEKPDIVKEKEGDTSLDTEEDPE